jgi:MYXO-CTERM domain-containing protein
MLIAGQTFHGVNPMTFKHSLIAILAAAFLASGSPTLKAQAPADTPPATTPPATTQTDTRRDVDRDADFDWGLLGLLGLLGLGGLAGRREHVVATRPRT